MKIMLLIFGVLTLNCYAAQFSCQDNEGHIAQLKIQSNNGLFWEEAWHSADSAGKYIGIEKAPFSDWKGYKKFQLTSFYQTDDSFYTLALEKTTGTHFKAFVYFDNDGHEEEVTQYQCTK